MVSSALPSIVDVDEIIPVSRLLALGNQCCESEIQKQAGSVPPESRAAHWLAWARDYADQIDPLSHGYLVNLIKSVPDMTIPKHHELA
jgi:hypothetical protein